MARHPKTTLWMLIKVVVLRQNSIRTENSAIPCRDRCPIGVIPSSPSAKILSRGNEPPRGVPVYIKDEGTRTFFATLRWFGLGGLIVPVVQPSQSHMRKDAT